MNYYFWLGADAELMERFYWWMVPHHLTWEEWKWDITH